MSTIREYLNEAKSLSKDGVLTLTIDGGSDVWHISDDYYEEAFSETDLADRLGAILARAKFKLKSQYYGDVLESLRDTDLLEDYPRDASGFDTYIADTIRENLYDCDFIDRSTEKYDHKRGFASFEAVFTMNIEDALACSDSYLEVLDSWDASVKTKSGTYTFQFDL